MQQWIYRNTIDNKARYVLGETGSRRLFCIGINPSTAEPDKLDRTLASVRARAESAGYDSWIMLNVYPQRATNPDNLHSAMNKDYHACNLKEIEKIFACGKIDIWAAWGTLINKRPYLIGCLKDIIVLARKYQASWFTAGNVTKGGHPHHPLYLKKDLPFVEFDIEGYTGII